jgi:hypothetical protein
MVYSTVLVPVHAGLSRSFSNRRKKKQIIDDRKQERGDYHHKINISLNVTSTIIRKPSIMSSNYTLPVYTAVCLDSNPQGSNTQNAELEEPLLNIETQTAIEAEAFDATPLNTSFCISGIILGFLVQLVNVGGTTYMYLRWGDEKITNTSQDGWFSHFVIWILTQSDLYLYIFMWIALTGVLTKGGMDHVRNTYFSESGMPTKRSVFVMGVNFYAGVVIGVFLTWTGIDVLLGLSVPMLPMIFVLLFGLFISYTMIWCYDLEDENEDPEY